MKKFRIIFQNTSIEAPEGTFLIGRSTECHLVLDDPSISRVHAAIVREKDILTAVDRGSRNGLQVNGIKIDGTRQLQDGDQITIGHQTIRILVIERSREGDKTLGLKKCSACEAWISGNASACPSCGAEALKLGIKETSQNLPSQPPKKPAPSIIERQPIAMLAGLALKAAQVSRIDEAEHLIENILTAVSERFESGPALGDGEFVSIIDAMVTLAETSESPKQISHIFAIHMAARRLMARELVERLYSSVRTVGYRACPMMTRYITFLDSRTSSFSPGERFVHRRLQGLVKVCS
jgi:FHA domain